LQVELEAVKPDGPGSTKEEEFRLSVALLPLRLRIDQNMVTFLQGFFTSSNPEHGTEEEEGKVTNASSTVQEPEGKNADFSSILFNMPFGPNLVPQPDSYNQTGLRSMF